MAYRLSRKAEDDIIKIFVRGVAEFGAPQAELYHRELEHTFRFLDDNPLAARLREEIDPPVRVHPMGSHLVIYKHEAKGDIFIVRVRHSREDWQDRAAP